MPDRRNALTPDALAMIDAIARSGSFAAAARELGKAPSALTYSVRQLEDALDVLLFDRRSGQARPTAAGTELLLEGRRLLQELDAVANRVRRVAGGWEATLALSVDEVISMPTVLDLVEAFCALNPEADTARAVGSGAGRPQAATGAPSTQGPPTRLRIRTGVLAGTWEALVAGQADLAIGVAEAFPNPGGIETRPLGTLPMVFCVAPHHPLARRAGDDPIGHEVLVHHRAVAVADTAQRMPALTVNLLPGQDVLTVPTMQAKVDALLRGLGCGHLPEPMARAYLQAGRLLQRATRASSPQGHLHYAWRAERGAAATGRALRWWLAQLASPTTRGALIERHQVPAA